jgi:hypothetical protein
MFWWEDTFWCVGQIETGKEEIGNSFVTSAIVRTAVRITFLLVSYYWAQDPHSLSVTFSCLQMMRGLFSDKRCVACHKERPARNTSLGWTRRTHCGGRHWVWDAGERWDESRGGRVHTAPRANAAVIYLAQVDSFPSESCLNFFYTLPQAPC